MKKGRSNRTAQPVDTMELPKSAILRRRNHFKRLFEGAVTVHSAPHISLRYYTFASREFDCKMAFIVAKRLGVAVKRNYVKRILREAYRKHRHELASTLDAASTGFHGAFSAKTVRMDYQTAEKEIINLLDRAASSLHAKRDL